MDTGKLASAVPARFHLAPNFDNDKTKDGWKLVFDDEAKEFLEPELEDILREGREHLDVEEPMRGISGGFGQRHAEAMLRNQSAIPVKWREYVLVFLNTLWRDSHGDRAVACLYWGGSDCYMEFYYIDNGFVSNYRGVRSRE